VWIHRRCSPELPRRCGTGPERFPGRTLLLRRLRIGGSPAARRRHIRLLVRTIRTSLHKCDGTLSDGNPMLGCDAGEIRPAAFIQGTPVAITGSAVHARPSARSTCRRATVDRVGIGWGAAEKSGPSVLRTPSATSNTDQRPGAQQSGNQRTHSLSAAAAAVTASVESLDPWASFACACQLVWCISRVLDIVSSVRSHNYFRRNNDRHSHHQRLPRHHQEGQ
jgi:hypothetical protein